MHQEREQAGEDENDLMNTVDQMLERAAGDEGVVDAWLGALALNGACPRPSWRGCWNSANCPCGATGSRADRSTRR